MPAAPIATHARQAPDRAQPAIGRFAIRRELGRGRQGAVFLGVDPQIHRPVAIKMLHTEHSGAHTERLIAEARIVGRLHHPNIIALHEIGEHDGRPFVVFEYVEGETLAESIRRGGAPDLSKSVIWMSQLLAALAHAHDHGVLHLDLKPANILIGSDGIPKVADFGVARMLWAKPGDLSALPGTVRYMCPERFANAPPAPGWDVFALGLIFREMLIGRIAIDAETDVAAIYRIVHETLSRPSAVNPRIDPRLDEVVTGALQKDPALRYRDAGAMKAALDRFRVPASRETLVAAEQVRVDATVEFLLRRMQHKGDFPVLSQDLSRISRIAANGDASAKELANAVLKDLALTKTLLGIANSAFYGPAGAHVTSIYQAILVMGVDQVRLAVGSLLCTAHLQGGPNAAALREIALRCFAAAMLAKNIAAATKAAAEEEAFICATFHHLGKSLTAHYLTDEYQAIEIRLASAAAGEPVASREILGIAYHELGQAVARAWKLPGALVESMAPYPPGPVGPPADARERLRQCTCLADEICDRIGAAAAPGAVRDLDGLATRYADGIGLPAPALAGMIAPAGEMSRKYAALVGIGVEGAEFMRRFEDWCAREVATAPSSAEDAAPEAQAMPPAAPVPVAADAASGRRSGFRAWLGAIWR